MAYDFSGMLVGGGTRPDAISGLDPEFLAVIQHLYDIAPPDVRAQMQITSGFRSPEVQAGLWQNALKKYGSEAAARKWVAPPGRSQHGFGNAIDWKFGSDAARNWVHENAGRFGGAFPLGNEPWHMELVGARGGSGGGGVTLNTPAPVANIGTPTSAPALSATSEAPSGPLGGLSKLVSGLSGRSGAQEQAQAEASQITPSTIGAEVGAGSPASAGAAQMMAALLEDRRNRYGLSLAGI